jgi:formate hydrogenlyase transcriptional activator
MTSDKRPAAPADAARLAGTSHGQATSALDPSMSSPDERDAVDDPVSRMFRLAVEQAPQGVLVLSDAGTILLANGAACTLFGYAAGELLYKTFTDLIPEAVEWIAPGASSFWSPTGSNPGVLVTALRRDGSTVPVEMGLSVVADGEIRYTIVSANDVTERLNLEARMAAATHEHLGFQRLVADIAATFVGVELDAVDAAIVDALHQLAETLQLDRGILWRKAPDESVARPLLHWTRPGVPVPEPLPLAAIPWMYSRVVEGEPTWFTTVDDLPDPIDRETFRRMPSRSGAMFPLAVTEDADGELSVLTFSSVHLQTPWPPAIIERLRLVAGIIGQAIARQHTHLALKRAHQELGNLRDQLAKENRELRHEVKVFRTSRTLVSESESVKRALAQVEQVAPTPATVLLLGETGSGKEVFAQAIHDLSPRHQRQMVRVSCAAIPNALIESELFGRERGAYTGALSRQIGRFEAAHQSTLFLDEIGDLPAEVQVKLLRVLQERVFERLGSTQPIKVDVRIIAATNRNLEQAAADKTFREDLFYRLNVFPIVVPPLRDRIQDIPGLVWAFIDEFSKSFGKTIDFISKESLRELQQYPWPGNVRELRNVIERAVIVATGPRLTVSPPRSLSKIPSTAMTLEALEIEHVRAVLESTNWRVRGAGGAAERLGIKPTTLESRMARLGIKRKSGPS